MLDAITLDERTRRTRVRMACALSALRQYLITLTREADPDDPEALPDLAAMAWEIVARVDDGDRDAAFPLAMALATRLDDLAGITYDEPEGTAE